MREGVDGRVSLTPLDVQNKEFGRAVRGYRPVEVDDFLDQVVEVLHDVQQENEVLREELEELRSRVDHYRQLEDTLQNTLVVAQETAQEVRENARREAKVILGEARTDIQRMRDEADEHVDRIHRQGEEVCSQILEYLTRAKAHLRTELEFIEKADDDLRDMRFYHPDSSPGEDKQDE